MKVWFDHTPAPAGYSLCTQGNELLTLLSYTQVEVLDLSLDHRREAKEAWRLLAALVREDLWPLKLVLRGGTREEVSSFLRVAGTRGPYKWKLSPRCIAVEAPPLS